MALMRSHNVYRVKVYNHEGRLTYSFRVAAFTEQGAQEKVINEVNTLGSIGPMFTVAKPKKLAETVFV